jgi:hypothetical protein
MVIVTAKDGRTLQYHDAEEVEYADGGVVILYSAWTSAVGGYGGGYGSSPAGPPRRTVIAVLSLSEVARVDARTPLVSGPAT